MVTGVLNKRKKGKNNSLKEKNLPEQLRKVFTNILR
jgi:hypothetical protein